MEDGFSSAKGDRAFLISKERCGRSITRSSCWSKQDSMFSTHCLGDKAGHTTTGVSA